MREAMGDARVAHLLRRLENDQVASRSAWPEAIHPTRCTVAAPEALYAWIFAPSVTNVSPDQIRKVAWIGKCLDDQRVACTSEPPSHARMLYVAALQFEVCAAVAELLPKNLSIWGDLRAELSAGSWSVLECARPMSERGGELSRDVADAMAIARGRAASARVAARLLHALGGSDPRSLLESIDAFFAAHTLLDSLRTWQDDLARRAITPLTAHLRETEPALFASAAAGGVAQDLLHLVFERVAEPLLVKAIDACDRARTDAASELLQGTWGEMIAELRAYLEGVLTDVRTIAGVPA